MSKDEYKRKILETHKKELYFDGQICPEATIKDIDENKIKKFIDKARRERKLHLNDLLSVKEILIRLKLMKNENLTNAAILLFAKNPQDFFIQQHLSEPFNPILARMFFWIRYIEEIGTGTNKIIHKNISQN